MPTKLSGAVAFYASADDDYITHGATSVSSAVIWMHGVFHNQTEENPQKIQAILKKIISHY